MRDRKKALEEIGRRAENIRRREKRKTGLLGTLTAALAFLLAVLLGTIPDRGVVMHASALGAFLLGPEIGAYVIVAVAAFILGVILTILFHRKNR